MHGRLFGSYKPDEVIPLVAQRSVVLVNCLVGDEETLGPLTRFLSAEDGAAGCVNLQDQVSDDVATMN